MEAIPVRISQKYQIVIPRAVRQTLDLHPEDTLLFLISGDSVILRSRPSSFTKAMRGLHKELWPDDSAGWLQQERDAWD